MKTSSNIPYKVKKKLFHKTITTIVLLHGKAWFYNHFLHLKDADRMANSVDPTQEQSGLGLHSLLRSIFLST